MKLTSLKRLHSYCKHKRILGYGSVGHMSLFYNNSNYYFIIIIIIIIIIINCNWVVTRWQWLFYMYTKYEIGY